LKSAFSGFGRQRAVELVARFLRCQLAADTGNATVNELFMLEIQYELAIPIPNGFSWTLTSILGKAITDAEGHFGKRDMNYTLLGLEYVTGDQPRIWFPGDCNHIAIQITRQAIGDRNEAIYQLSHEVIHCLIPKEIGKESVLEEGIATWFSRNFVVDGYIPKDFNPLFPNYEKACKMVERLLKMDSGVVKKLRDVNPNLAHLGLLPHDILSVCPQCPKELAETLGQKFLDYSGHVP
jgi:hypothetical protein